MRRYWMCASAAGRSIPWLSSSLVRASGYEDWALPERLRDQPRLTKPFRQHDLEEQVRLLMTRATASTS